MLLVYARIPNKQIISEAQEGIKAAHEFFRTHPNRRVARVEVWYRKQIRVRRHFVEADINAARDEAMK